MHAQPCTNHKYHMPLNQLFLSLSLSLSLFFVSTLVTLCICMSMSTLQYLTMCFFFLSCSAPTLSVTIDPQPIIIIADIPPYNNYTLTCSATIPQDLVHLQARFNIYDAGATFFFSANYTPVQDCQTVTSTGDRLCSYSVMVTETANLDSPRRNCSVELSTIDRTTSRQITIAQEGASVLLLVNSKLKTSDL